MPTPDELLAIALGHHQAGNLRQAEEIYRRVLQTNPHNANAWHLLGLAAHHAGRNQEAIELIRQAIALDHAQAIFHSNLGLAYAALGKTPEAMASYTEALRLQPEHANVHNNLGAMLYRQGRLAQAETSFREAVRLQPNYTGALSNLGAVCKATGRIDEAIACYRQALRADPAFPEAHSNLGTALLTQGQIVEAMACYQHALRLKPDYADAHNNLGAAFQRQGRLAEAVACCREAIRLRPNLAAAHKNLATYLQELGDWSGALACLERAQALAPEDGLKIRAILALPIIYPSTGEIARQRRRVDATMVQLRAETLSILDPMESVGATAFELAYQGLNDRDVQAGLASIYLRATPSLAYVAPYCARPAAAAGRPLQIGFLSRFFHSHTIGRLNVGLIRQLPRADFRVILLRPPGKDDAMAKSIQESADAVVPLPEHLEQARQRIAEQQLDMLFYTDIGMDPFTYFLAFARLARAQCVTWGHPVTSGIPAIDYFISSDLLETEQADQHYTEKLVRLKTLSTYYYRPAPPPRMKDRAAFGLPEDGHIYGCPQSLFKLHPDFDALLGAILQRDPKGILVLISGKHTAWDDLVRQRLARTIREVAHRVRFLPRMSHEDFLSLNAACDVLLDPIHFGGGNTAYEAFALGVPIVTCPSAFLRGRITFALYKKMNIMECVALSTNQYVELAIRLGTEGDFRGEVKKKILAANSVLYED
ncbi:MAG TPA: tetratricopeptide repeat protein, partial [Gemmataceae bacterium]|nr:tetratricopeptide repeat protein [Gemmataceae bacterium]